MPVVFSFLKAPTHLSPACPYFFQVLKCSLPSPSSVPPPPEVAGPDFSSTGSPLWLGVPPSSLLSCGPHFLELVASCLLFEPQVLLMHPPAAS